MTPPLDILLVEDNPGDVLLTEEAFDASAAGHRVRVASDGDGALSLLRSAAAADDLPDLVLLDLHLPGRTGHEVLAAIKDDPTLGRLPVLMLTSSSEDRDVRRSYELHSSCHVTKPMDLDGYLGTVGAVEEFWRSTVRLPRRTS